MTGISMAASKDHYMRCQGVAGDSRGYDWRTLALAGRVEAFASKPFAIPLRGSGSLIFVSAGAVEAGHWHVEQPVVNGELGAMMDQVIQHDAANAGNTRHGENLLATSLEGPTLHQIRVTNGRKCGPSFRGLLVKDGQKILLILDLRG